MKRNEIIQEVGKPVLRPMGVIQLVFVLAIAVSPFIWMWHSWYFAWRTCLTGVIGALIIYGIHSIAIKTISEAVDKELANNKHDKPKSTFHTKLENMMRES